MKALDKEEIEEGLGSLPGWTYDQQCISKEFHFKDFSENFAFMTQVAMLAELQNHHPDWSGGYNRLKISLSTHEVGTISVRDLRLAGAIEKIVINQTKSDDPV
jgi:4a-hydroxytetrahydrobiopterin dehydratase